MTTSPHIFTRPDTAEEKPVWVLVRVGEHRHRFHTDLQCTALHSKLNTSPALELMTEVAALGLGLPQCGKCRH
ncbi:hypothetical protein [Streptomyces racemochromogenes]|uniref:hypothetical protein n=1 Tax=Streptomyces racemochromogenes TaxID=67353 RepID=UPI0031E68AC2